MKKVSKALGGIVIFIAFILVFMQGLISFIAVERAEVVLKLADPIKAAWYDFFCHCERSEVISAVWDQEIASSFTLLAMTVEVINGWTLSSFCPY